MNEIAEIEGYELHYEVTGPEEGRPLVLMHGWGCDHTTVRSIAAVLETGMRVYNIDLPGHGQSPEPPDVWGVEEYTRLIEGFVSQMQLDRPVLAGHSFGGRICILLASRNKTGKVLLVDSAGIKPRRPLSYYRKVYSYKLLKKLLLLFLGKERGAAAVDRLGSRRGSADYRNSTPVMRKVMAKCVNEDLKHVMPSIQSPVLLVWGDDDTATPLSDARQMERLIPDAGIVSFKGCGHYSFLDNPGGFRAVISEFFKDELFQVSHAKPEKYKVSNIKH